MILTAVLLAMFPVFDTGEVTFSEFDSMIVNGKEIAIRDDRLTYRVYIKHVASEPWPTIPWTICTGSPCRFASLRLPPGAIEYVSVTAHRQGIGEGPH